VRAVLAVLALAAALAVSTGASPAAKACRITPSQGAGPYGTNGVAPPRRSKIGTGHVLTGRVLRFPDCAPIKGAVVDYWQAGPRGYTPAGRGRVITRADGSFRIEGPVPSSDDGRPPHIHLRVFYGGYEELVTTYFVPRGSHSGRLTLVLEPLL
jgi:protocatechuate 3,4-dioxygenase beta subunit